MARESKGNELEFTQSQLEWEKQQEFDLELKAAAKNEFASLEDDIREELINKCVTLFITQGVMCRNLIKQEAVKPILKGFGSKTRHLVKPLIVAAQKRLRAIFGFDLAVARKANVENGPPREDGPELERNTWVLKNILKGPAYLKLLNESSQAAAAKRGLLTMVLALIFVNKKLLSEADLFKQLAKIDRDFDSPRRHPVFGDATKLISKVFTKHHYVTRKKNKDEEFEYRIGSRALAEIGVVDIAAFVLSITHRDSQFDDNDIRNWCGQYAEEFVEIEVDGSDAGEGEGEGEGEEESKGEPEPEPEPEPKRKRRRTRR